MHKQQMAAVGLAWQYMIGKGYEHQLGGFSGVPTPKPVSGKKAWKIRRQHGTGRRK